ncbi:hypothetical protein MMIC_P0279 [Mariprofundus micogutta]|uniref:HEAT repeat protein n=1 Tax=Mariprofundus micogutta TaxID=1921010 RepID=A0A1L8CKD6_9PROT|nr:hypothetical protein [Mariprofundus micogutta]GAV19345.1 hypothetical protein MMIC_P0279 [Mariprofundus micogutta]
MVEEFANDEERTLFLLETLLNKNESLQLRDSAATYLGHHDSDKALKSLIECACNDHEDARLLTACGDAIAEIWDRNKNFDIDVVLAQVAIPAQLEIRGWINSK